MFTLLSIVRAESPGQPIIDRLLMPFRLTAVRETVGGVAILAATAAAIAWANSPWRAAYEQILGTTLNVAVGDWTATITFSQFVNDGLAAILFFLLSLEIKRELLLGELGSPRLTALTIAAAIGGIAVPMALYAAVAHSSSGLRGWSVPIATDVVLVLGVLSLTGRRLPKVIKGFIAVVAIAGNIGAILMMALLTSAGVEWLTAAGLILGVAWLANILGFRDTASFVAIGVMLWFTTVASGVHGAVAGALFALTIPRRGRIDREAFLWGVSDGLGDFVGAAAQAALDPDRARLANTRRQAAVREIQTLCGRAQPPLLGMANRLRGPVALGVLPLVAFVNAGVFLSGDELLAALSMPVATGVFVGLLVGKPMGIIGFSWLAVRWNLASLPHGAGWRVLIGAATMGGVGFTMSLFTAGLAFGDNQLLSAARLGALAASICSAIVGLLVLSGVNGEPGQPPLRLT